MSGTTRYTPAVRRYSSLSASLFGLTALLVTSMAGAKPPGKAPAPVPDTASGNRPAEAAPVRTDDPVERARRGVVTIERGGEVLSLGSVLKNDGRILTALSPIGDGNSLNVRFPDGTSVPARVGHRDRVWDLALLVPQVGRWPEGLGASDADALRSGAQLRAFSSAKGGKVQPATVVFRGKRSLLGADDQLIRDVFEVPTKIGPKEFGSPVVDESGNVVAVLGRACVPVEKGPCAPTAFGVPVDALRAFLRTTPVSAVPPAAWLGIQGVSDRQGAVQGVRVNSVSPDSPANEAGLKAGPDTKSNDMIVAVDDQPVASPDAISTIVRNKSVGDRIKLLVLGANGKLHETTTVLRPAPSQQSK